MAIICLPSLGIRGGALYQLDMIPSQTTLKLGLETTIIYDFSCIFGSADVGQACSYIRGLLGIIQSKLGSAEATLVFMALTPLS